MCEPRAPTLSCPKLNPLRHVCEEWEVQAMCSLQEVGAKGRLVWVLVLTLCCNEQGMLLGILLQLFCFLFLSPGIMLSEQFARWGYYYYFFLSLKCVLHHVSLGSLLWGGRGCGRDHRLLHSAT